MTKRSVRLYTTDVLDCITKIEKYIIGLTFSEFEKNDLVVDAVIRNIEIIGEAARNIPQSILELHPQIDWKKIIGLRNIAAHVYFNVDLTIVWRIVKNRLPKLKNTVTEILSNMPEE